MVSRSGLRLRVRDDLLVLDFDPDLVIYDEASGECHVLMGGAVVVWTELEASTTGVEIEVLVARLRDRVGVAPEEISRQILETVESMRDLGLLAESA